MSKKSNDAAKRYMLRLKSATQVIRRQDAEIEKLRNELKSVLPDWHTESVAWDSNVNMEWLAECRMIDAKRVLQLKAKRDEIVLWRKAMETAHSKHHFLMVKKPE